MCIRSFERIRTLFFRFSLLLWIVSVICVADFFAGIFRLMFYSEEGLTEQAVPCRIARLCLCIVTDLLA